MKFVWKVFFTTMFISTLCVTLSGYLLIHSNFQSQLDSEIATAQDYGAIVYYSLAGGFEHSAASADFENAGTPQDGFLQIVRSLSISSMNQTVPFAIVDEGKTAVYSTLPIALDKDLVSSLDTTSMGWTLKEAGHSVFVQTMRPVVYLDRVFYIETVRDVTHVFDTQRSQYEMLIKILAGMLLLAGVLTFVISKLLLRPITALTETTKRISGGNLGERSAIRGRDEIALLSQHFNQMADHLEEKMSELQEEARRKELFVGAFSHELKTPLTSIIGYADLLRQKEMTPGQRNICAEYIFSEGKRLEALSMRLLDLIVVKNRDFSPKPTEIGHLLDEVRTLMAPQLIAAGVRLTCDAAPAVLPMEADLMKTVFLNLIDNARKAMEEGGEIHLTGQTRQDCYTLTIRDSGKGMEPQELSRITDAFYMVDKSRSRSQGGAGLGLALCKEILLLHGFTLSFDSAVGVGTAVTVTMKEGNA